MSQAEWSALYEKFGVETKNSAGPLHCEPFAYMAAMAKASELPTSSVAVSLSAASDDYSRVRLTVTIKCPCVTADAPIKFITEAAFLLARRMVNEGAASLGIPPVE